MKPPKTRSFTKKVNCKVTYVWSDRQNRYVIGERCVLYTPCPWCKAEIGNPCQSKQGTVGWVHTIRRQLGSPRLLLVKRALGLLLDGFRGVRWTQAQCNEWEQQHLERLEREDNRAKKRRKTPVARSA